MFNNGMTYEGDYEDDVKHGKGVLTWPDHVKKYEGEWACGKMHGFGTMTHKDGRQQKGVWTEG